MNFSSTRLWIFDLDGTLIDSRLDLVSAVNATLRFLNLNTLPEDTIIGYVGDGADDLLRKSLRAAGVPEAEAAAILPETLRWFLEYYGEHCLDRTVPYPGILRLLDRLRARPETGMAVLTNKPEKPAIKILEHLEILGHFSHIVGGDGPLGKKPDPAGLAYILREMRTEAKDAVLVGDSLQDFRTARAGGVPFVAFLSGFGDSAALAAAGPDHAVRHADELLELVGPET
jgi:phosphoglycolate phosphatase